MHIPAGWSRIWSSDYRDSEVVPYLGISVSGKWITKLKLVRDEFAPGHGA